MNDELDKYYALLGVAPHTPARDLKEAYRDLAKVWHPDRFSHDPRLQQKAQERLKEINEAYERLTSGKAARRTRPPSTTVEPDAAPTTTARRKRPKLTLSTAIIFCAALLVALITQAPQDARPARQQTQPAEQVSEARTADERQQPESESRPAAAPSPRGNERAARKPAAQATSVVASEPQPAAPSLRPLPTVTVTLDAVTGLLATRDCPTTSRMTYPAGDEPRQHCTIQHKTKVTPQAEANDSRVKSIGKGMAAPFKWLKGERGTGAN